MSHSKERQNKNCLNCNALVYGKYCHICGQENVEPAETVWALITHFFNDITHFDGKFFSTLKLLITRPGFLSAEYKRGRRASYLNPVRMYIFTSFAFFIIFFSVYDIEKEITTGGNKYTLEQIDKMDSVELKALTEDINDGKAMSREAFKNYIDSSTSRGQLNFGSVKYDSKEQYDSLIKVGAINPGWFKKKLMYRQFEINEKYKNDDKGVMTSAIDIFLHMFPQILFVSLPIFAFILWLLYLRRKDFYFVSHGIFSVHLYIFYFISLLFLIAVKQLEKVLHWTTLSNWIIFFLLIGFLLYEYKAMRHFYRQGRAKTMLKFFLAIMCRFLVIIFLATVFFIFSIFKL